MYVIDRTIAIIRPKQPLVGWINSVSHLGKLLTLEEVGRECLTFLMPLYVREADAEEALRHLLTFP